MQFGWYIDILLIFVVKLLSFYGYFDFASFLHIFSKAQFHFRRGVNGCQDDTFLKAQFLVVYILARCVTDFQDASLKASNEPK